MIIIDMAIKTPTVTNHGAVFSPKVDSMRLPPPSSSSIGNNKYNDKYYGDDYHEY